jgi:hypothetical protein
MNAHRTEIIELRAVSVIHCCSFLSFSRGISTGFLDCEDVIFCFLFGSVICFPLLQTRKTGQSDHLNLVFFGKPSACGEFLRVIGCEEDLMEEPSVSPHRVTQLLQQWVMGMMLRSKS